MKGRARNYRRLFSSLLIAVILLNHMSGFTVLAKTITDVINAAYEQAEDFSKASPSVATASEADACYTKDWENEDDITTDEFARYSFLKQDGVTYYRVYGRLNGKAGFYACDTSGVPFLRAEPLDLKQEKALAWAEGQTVAKNVFTEETLAADDVPEYYQLAADIYQDASDVTVYVYVDEAEEVLFRVYGTVADEDDTTAQTPGFYACNSGGELLSYEAETDRDVTVFAFDQQPTTLLEVQAMIAAYETAYQAAMDEGGFMAALEVQKPRWQYEVDSSLMPGGWRCDYLEDETYHVSYWSFFPAPMAMAADASAGTSAELTAAINSASGTGYVIEITSDIDISDLSAACTIDSGKDIIIRSDTDGLWTLTQSQTDIRHFTVNANGKLTLENIVLDGSRNCGGVVVNRDGSFIMDGCSVIENCSVSNTNGGGVRVDGSFVMNDDSGIQGCSSPWDGGGVYVTGTFTMNGGTISGNKARNGGGVYTLGGSSGFTMNDGAISVNSAEYSGGGVGMYNAAFTMNGGTISTNTANGTTASSVYGGGGVGMGDGGCSLIMSGDAAISGNKAANGSGGGVLVYRNSSLILNNNAIISNNTAKEGGGVYISGGSGLAGGTFNMKSGEISGNTATTNGGGVCYYGTNPSYPVTFNMEGGVVSGNKASGTGGGVYLYGSASSAAILTITDGTVSENKAVSGSGIYAECYNSTATQTLTLTRAVIANNESSNTTSGGGGIYLSGFDLNSCANQKLTVTDSEFRKNKGATGGGIGAGSTSAITIEGTSFIENMATMCGGGVFLNGNAGSYTPIVAITNSSFTRNEVTGLGAYSVYGGGGICLLWKGTLTVDEVSFEENKSVNNGGGLHINSSTPTVTVQGATTFTNNEAVVNGGGIYTASPSKLTTANDTVFSGNRASRAYDYGIANRGSAGAYPNIDWYGANSIPGTHVLNNYDINWDKGTPPTVYAVTYNGNGATGGTVPVDSTSYLANTSATVLGNTGNLTRTDGYVFAKWNNRADGTGADYAPGESLTVVGNTTLYAIWKLNEHTVTFDAKGGTPAPADQLVEYGDKLTEPPEPGKEGYDFGGWYTDPGCTDGNEWNFDDDTVTANIELTAKWTIKTYTVVFYDDDGLTVLGSYTVDHNDNVTPPAAPQKPDDAQYSYTFIGWMPGGSYAVGDPVTQDMAFTAEYSSTEQPYTVTFYDYDGLTVLGSHDVVYGAVVTAPENPVRVGDTQYSYTFSGWMPGDSGYTLMGLQSVTRDMIFTASYDATAKTYIGTFDADGGTPEPDDQSVQYGDKLTKPAEDPKKDGYTFDGWYNNGAEWDFDTDTVTGDTVLIAKWTINKYTAAFNSNGGSAVDSQVVEYGKTVTAPANPIRTNYTFRGWYRDNGTFRSAWNFDSDTVTEDITLYARWTYNSSGGGGGGTPTTPTTPTTPDPTEPETEAETPTTPVIPPTVSPGHSIVPRSEREYDEFDENGVPLGTWRLLDDNTTWILDEYVPLGGLVKTGDSRTGAWIWLSLSCISLCGLILSGRARRDKAGRQKED